MIDWRTLMKAPQPGSQNPQNAQNARDGVNFEDIEDIAQKDWLAAWRDVAAISSGLTHDDPRVQPVMVALKGCDAAFEAGDWVAFKQARQTVLTAMETYYDQ